MRDVLLFEMETDKLATLIRSYPAVQTLCTFNLVHRAAQRQEGRLCRFGKIEIPIHKDVPLSSASNHWPLSSCASRTLLRGQWYTLAVYGRQRLLQAYNNKYGFVRD